jgi:hypothetical protein
MALDRGNPEHPIDEVRREALREGEAKGLLKSARRARTVYHRHRSEGRYPLDMGGLLAEHAEWCRAQAKQLKGGGR